MVSAGTLFIVATPIGNLEDLSPRAARVLREADVIAAEDTRSAQTLLRRADLDGGVNGQRRIVSLFEGNEAGREGSILAAIDQGAKVAVISEAGTPGVADPGARLVRAAIAAGLAIEVIPGPAACIAALVASGLPMDRFVFLGFPPREDGPRQQLFGSLRFEPGTLVFYESPQRIATTLGELATALGEDRPACLSREITKVHEEHRRGTLRALASAAEAAGVRGECTLVVGGSLEAEGSVDIEAEVKKLLALGHGPRDVSSRLMLVTGKPRRQLYQLALALSRRSDGDDGDGSSDE